MYLPTPPATSSRGKENRFPVRVVTWSPHNRYHTVTASSPPKISAASSVSQTHPLKSILKQPTHILLPLLDDDDDKREITPEPSDPLTDLKYLEYPVSIILAPNSSLRELITGYHVLTARLKASVSGTTDADASWPLFQPLRKHCNDIVSAFIRDIGKALVDPLKTRPLPVESLKEQNLNLPSPKSSPRKKQGMTADEVKYARDLCTTCHAVLKLLATIFTLPAVYKVFSDDQLLAVLTQVLAIPMANELPTPNARKTYALSIWLLQVQRLPAEVLAPAAARIASALERGIDGDLGKEGKKGSISDGLKAIHDLAIYQPSTFVPAFCQIMSPILFNLLSSNLNIRTQACHALGGLVEACASLPYSIDHLRISLVIASFLTTPPAARGPSKSPSKTPQEVTIIRTLRTTLGATDPQNPAQGPVWALCVLANLIVLTGPILCVQDKLIKVIGALLALAMRHNKSSVRALGCLVWRCVAWVYMLPRTAETGVDDEGKLVYRLLQGRRNSRTEQSLAQEKEWEESRENLWKVLLSVVDMGAGVATVAGLLIFDGTDGIKRAMAVIRAMIKRGGQTCGDAMEMVKHFVSVESTKTEMHMQKLLPTALFSAVPGLLTVDYKSLVSVVRPIFNQCPQLDDVRSFTREEVAKDWVFEGLVKIWREGLANLEIPENAETPSEVIDIWDGLLKANVAVLQDAGDDNETSNFAVRAVEILIDICQDTTLDFYTESTTEIPTSPVKDFNSSPHRSKTETPHLRSNAAIKLSVVRDLWTTTRTAIPHTLLRAAGQKFIAMLVQHESELLSEADSQDDARKQWSLLCADVLVVCDLDEIRSFWGNKGSDEKPRDWKSSRDVSSLVWGCFVEKWTEDGEVSWEGAVVLLSVPFVEATAWDLSNDDLLAWDNFLNHVTNHALDSGVDSNTLLDHVADCISQNLCPTFMSSVRVADLLMSHLDMAEARQTPSSVLELVNDVLQSSYPPEPRNMVTSMWMIRSLTRVIDTCPLTLAQNLLESLQDGLSTWISDEWKVFSPEEYAFDILSLYETILVGIQSIPLELTTLSNLAPVLESAFYGRDDKPVMIREAFAEFWKATYFAMEEPKDGWPVRIQTCLQSAFGLPTIVTDDDSYSMPEDTAYDADTSLDNIESDLEALFEIKHDSGLKKHHTQYDTEEEEEEEEEEIQPERPALFAFTRRSLPTITDDKPDGSLFSGHSSPALFTPILPVIANKSKILTDTDSARRSPLDLFGAFDPPSTPIKFTTEHSRISTPPRPHKPSSTFSLRLCSPTTPELSTQRITTTPKLSPMAHISNQSGSGSSTKRRRTENKENISPSQVIASVMERIATKSSTGLKASVLGKRGVYSGDQEDTESKRIRTDSGLFTSPLQSISLVDSGDRRGSEFPVEYALPKTTLEYPSRRYEDVFNLDAGAVTSGLKIDNTSPRCSKKRKGIFMDSVEIPTLRQVRRRQRRTVSFDSRLVTPPNRGLRRTRSAMKSPKSIIALEFLEANHTIKRRRDPGSSVEDLFLSTPVQEHLNVTLGSDDSILVAEKSPNRLQAEHSSDDDQHEGQVTPHHLISPTLRRVKISDNDPPSDDSNMSSSPLREVAARRLERARSFVKSFPTKLAFDTGY